MHNNCRFIVFLMFIIVITFLFFFTPPPELSRGVGVINDEQRGLESELRMVAPNPQLAISLASINISFYCVYMSSGRRGEGTRCILPLTREYTRTHSGGTLIAAPVYAYDQ